jgi:rod shape-determining protein MreD
MSRFLPVIILTVVLIVIQTTVMSYLAVAGLTPDVLLIWIVYLAVARGQLTATVTGFLAGLVMDLLSGSDGMLGLSALAKSSGGFVAGYFFNENKIQQTLGTYRFLLIIAAAAFVHNLIYFIIFLQGSSVTWWHATLYYGLPAALYTTATGLIPMFVFARRTLT